MQQICYENSVLKSYPYVFIYSEPPYHAINVVLSCLTLFDPYPKQISSFEANIVVAVIPDSRS